MADGQLDEWLRGKFAVRLTKRLLGKSYVSEFIELGIHDDISPGDYLFEIGVAETAAKEYSKDIGTVRKSISSLEQEASRYQDKIADANERLEFLKEGLEGIQKRVGVANITPQYYLDAIEKRKQIVSEGMKLQKKMKEYDAEIGIINNLIAEKSEKELKPLEMLGSQIEYYRKTLIDCATKTHSWEAYQSHLAGKQPSIHGAPEGSLDVGQYGTEILGASVLSEKLGAPQAISQELRDDSLEYLAEMEGLLEYSEYVSSMKNKDGIPLWKIRLENEMKRINQEFSEFMQYLQAKKTVK